jgi:chromosome segregation ATPase
VLFRSEGDQLRGNRQRILAGNLGGNAKAIGAELANIRDQLKRGVGNQGDLQNKSKKLTKALEELANQSGRTSEIMSKIEEAKAKRETARDFAKDFVFGTNEQRDTMQKDISNARTAAQQGNLSSVAEEDRAGVGAMFERFKDLPIFNGMTGRQAQNKVIANEVRASGGGEDMARMIEQDMSSPEEKLIQELKNTADSEMAAREELFNKEEENIKENMTALDNNTAALKSFVDNLATAKANAETAKAEVEKNQDKAPDVKALEEQRKNLTAEIEKTKINIDKFAGKIRELTDAIDFAIKKMYQDIENRGTAEKGAREGAALQKAGASQMEVQDTAAKATSSLPARGPKMAKGGLVYLAKGGDVFKPQGTDTVRAMLTPGEFVIKKSSVDKIGSDKLNQLNQGGDVKAFAKGGLVSYLQMGGLASSNGDVIDKLSKRVTKLEKETKELLFNQFCPLTKTYSFKVSYWYWSPYPY